MTGVDEPEPVKLPAPEELEPAELPEPVEPADPEPAVLVEPLEPAVFAELPDPAVFAEPPEPEVDPAVFAELVAAVAVLAVRESAGSCPVTRTTAITAHTIMKNATEYPTTRPRIIRTRARLICLICIASVEVMQARMRRLRSNRVCPG